MEHDLVKARERLTDYYLRYLIQKKIVQILEKEQNQEKENQNDRTQ